jgi:hypothetical protein
MRRTLSALLLIIFAQLVLATGTTSSPLLTECPTITMETPSSTICPLATVTFTAGVTGGDPVGQQTYHWTVSAGKIVSGQGTQTITVATADAQGSEINDGVKATVEVGGLGQSCSNAASYTVRVDAFCSERKFDEYGDISFDDEKVRLESFINKLQSEPDTLGLITIYASVHARPGEAEARLERIRNYLVNLRGLNADRIYTKDGGGREELTVQLWVMPTKIVQDTNSHR